MPFVVPGVCRFTIHGTNEIGACDNVLDYRIDTTGALTSREDAIFQQCGQIINAWAEEILPRLSTTYSLESVSWVDLDEADGSVGIRTTTDDFTLPDPGGFGGEAAPANVSVLVRKATTPRRGQRQGRIYFSPIGEAGKNGSFLTPVELAAWESAVADFLSKTQEDVGDPADGQPFLCVVHILTRDPVTGAPLTGNSTDVEELAAQELLATQRRRLRR